MCSCRNLGIKKLNYTLVMYSPSTRTSLRSRMYHSMNTTHHVCMYVCISVRARGYTTQRACYSLIAIVQYIATGARNIMHTTLVLALLSILQLYATIRLVV